MFCIIHQCIKIPFWQCKLKAGLTAESDSLDEIRITCTIQVNILGTRKLETLLSTVNC